MVREGMDTHSCRVRITGGDEHDGNARIRDEIHATFALPCGSGCRNLRSAVVLISLPFTGASPSVSSQFGSAPTMVTNRPNDQTTTTGRMLSWDNQALWHPIQLPKSRVERR